MRTLLPIVIGILYSTGLYMLLRRSMVKLIIGLGLLGHASNLLIFVAASGGGLVRGSPPIVGLEKVRAAGAMADPVPQALILTAIVIGFGVQVFALALFHRTYQAVGTDDLDAFTTTEES